MENKEIWNKNYWKIVKNGIKIAGYILFFLVAGFLITISFIDIYSRLFIK